jgi:uncharacterized protein (TIGR00730 family)
VSIQHSTRRSVCVFCGSRPGIDPRYIESAAELGTALAAAGHRLVYGAGDVGMMGAVASAAQEAGGATLGVVPVHLLGRERRARDPRGVIVTETMHERKKVMFMNADAIVALPGGPGTLDELFEVLTWRQLGLHAKPVLLLNVGGYWDPLLALLEHIARQGFVETSFLGYLGVASDVATLVARLGEADAVREPGAVRQL